MSTVNKKQYVLSLIDLLNIGFLFILLGFLISTHNINPYTDKLYALYGIILIFIGTLAFWRKKSSGKKSNNVYFLLSTVLIFVILYESISGLLPIFAGEYRFDSYIDGLDKQIFGISPTVWMQAFIHPVLTEFLYILYFIYFILPVLLVFLLYRKKAFKHVEISLFTLFINYYGAYISYFIFPVEGPRYFLAGEHTKNLDGLILSSPLRDFINFCEPSTLDCFPSLHASILVVITLLAKKYYKSLLKPFFYLSIIIIFSLVYLRYHYILDILTGIIWAVISVYLGALLYDKFENKFSSLLIRTND